MTIRQNAIESMNARLRGVNCNRGQFPTEQAALKVLYLVVLSLARLPQAEQRDPQFALEGSAQGVHDLLRRTNPDARN